MSSVTLCPHCRKEIDLQQETPYTYNYRSWATPIFMSLISLMLLGMDYFHNNEINWSHWATIGIWIIYTVVQLLRSATYYGWIIIPIGGAMLSLFFYFLDRSTGSNSRTGGLDWAGWAIIPIVTFVIAFPIIARYARDQPNEIERLELFVDQLSYHESERLQNLDKDMTE